jgi:hypothetical protein
MSEINMKWRQILHMHRATLTSRIEERKLPCDEWTFDSRFFSFEPLPFRVQPRSDILGNLVFIVHFQRVHEYQTWQRGFWFWLVIVVGDSSRIHDDAQRPMQILVDWDENKLLFENVDVLLGCP